MRDNEFKIAKSFNFAASANKYRIERITFANRFRDEIYLSKKTTSYSRKTFTNIQKTLLLYILINLIPEDCLLPQKL